MFYNGILYMPLSIQYSENISFFLHQTLPTTGATCKIEKNKLGWKVPSQSGNGTYIVNLDHGEPFCTCPDFEKRQQPCKHIHAVEFLVQRKTKPDGSTTYTQSVKVTCTQDWPAYNAAQSEKKRRFGVLSADKGYIGHKKVAAVEAVNALPFIPFKSNTLPTTEDSAWGRMYHYFMLKRDEFLAHYHRRSNVESVFSMVKAKFGDCVRSKSDTGMVNEVLAKILCHNICVLIQAIHELRIEPNFCAQLGLAQKIG